MLAAIIFFIYLFAFVFDYLPLIKKGKKMEIFVYGFIFLASFFVLFLPNVGVKLPKASPGMEAFAKKVLNRK